LTCVLVRVLDNGVDEVLQEYAMIVRQIGKCYVSEKYTMEMNGVPSRSFMPTCAIETEQWWWGWGEGESLVSIPTA
jgi:hypothetical protein